MRLLLAAAAALLAATPAFATDWVSAGRGGNAVIIFAERDSLKRLDDGRVQIRLLYVPAREVDDIFAFDTIAEFDCPNKRYRRLHIDARSAEGVVLGTQTPPSDWHPTSEGDVSGGLLNFVCTSEIANQEGLGDRGLPDIIAAGRKRLSELD